MKKELSQYHKGTNDYMYNDFLPPENTKTFTGLLVSIEWWHQKGKYALICNFKKEDGSRISLFAFQKYTGFYGPKSKKINFKEVALGTRWLCKIRKSSTGRLTWHDATQIT